MFRAKKLDRLVSAQIITPTQKQQILNFDDASGWNMVVRALAGLGIFTIGLGIISLVASNWQDIGRMAKLLTMFIVLFGSSGLALYWRQKGEIDKSEKMLAGLFFLVGAGIGLVIQVFQLGGGEIYVPFGFWCAVTLPLLFVALRGYVAFFWVPLFLAWCVMYIFSGYRPYANEFEVLMALFACLAAIGALLENFLPSLAVGPMLKKDALIAFYLVLASYIIFAGFDGTNGLVQLGKAGGILAVLSLIYHYFKDYRRIRLNIKFGGLAVAMLYVNLGTELGLFETGIGLIISGAVLLLLLKFLPRVLRLVHEEKQNVQNS